MTKLRRAVADRSQAGPARGINTSTQLRDWKRTKQLDVAPPGGGVTDHGDLTGLLDDDHTQYQLESEKAAANGYASLDGTTKVPTAQLATGTPDGTKFLRDDRSWQPASGSGAPTDAEYAVAAAHAGLSAERVITDTATVTKDTGTAGQIKFNVPANSVDPADHASTHDVGGSDPVTDVAFARGLKEAGDPADLEVAEVPNGYLLGRSDNTIVGVDPSTVGPQAEIVKISGSSGAAGANITWQRLSANAAANATTTLATVMTTTSVGAGTWAFRYKVIYQAAATSTGVDFAINHTGTVTNMVVSSWFATSGGTAANALADQTGSNTASLCEAKSQRTINTKMGSTLGVDTANANMLIVIEGIIVVSATGSLELRHASELAASTQVMADTVLELHKIA